MKQFLIWTVVAAALTLTIGAPRAFAQGTFKIPFPFKAADTSLPKGDYTVTPKDDTHLTLRQESTGKEFDIAFIKKLPQPNPTLTEPQLVFDVVGDFAPSYTEYITVYLLAEAWPGGADGFQVHVSKGAHKTQVLKGAKAK